MPADRPYRQHLRNSQSLVTTYEEIRAGFVALALERNRRATPYVEQARALKVLASRAVWAKDLTGMPDIETALLTAAGISDKAAGHLLEDDKKQAILGLVENFLEPAGADFVEELVFRFLLTRGDTLGGAMRNVGGIMAQRKLLRAILSAIGVAGMECYWLHTASCAWIKADINTAGIEFDARGLSWKSRKGWRTMVFNMKAPLVRNNIDVCILNCAHDLALQSARTPESYLAIAEIKGGIDPAGADEHWKTARTAISRIRAAFAASQLAPRVFYVGAAIVAKMASEIWEQLETGTLDNAANLTDNDQIVSLCRWIISL